MIRRPPSSTLFPYPPLSRSDRPLPPFFAPVGTRDPLLDDTRRLEKALLALNVPVEARYYPGDRKSTRLNSSHSQISYAVFCLKKKLRPVRGAIGLAQRI